MSLLILVKKTIGCGERVLFVPLFLVLAMLLCTDVTASVTDKDSNSITIDIDEGTVKEIILRLYLKSGYWVRLADNYKQQKINYHVDSVSLKDGIKSLLKVVGVRNYALIFDDQTKEIFVFITESDEKSYNLKPSEKKASYVPTEYDRQNLPPGDLALPSREDIGPVEVETNMADYNIPPQDRSLPKPDELGPVTMETNIELSSIPFRERTWPSREQLGPIPLETDKSLAHIPPQDRALPSPADLGLN